MIHLWYHLWCPQAHPKLKYCQISQNYGMCTPSYFTIIGMGLKVENIIFMQLSGDKIWKRKILLQLIPVKMSLNFIKIRQFNFYLVFCEEKFIQIKNVKFVCSNPVNAMYGYGFINRIFIIERHIKHLQSLPF